MKTNHFKNLSEELDQLVDKHIAKVMDESETFEEVISKLIEDRSIQNLSNKYNYIKRRIELLALSQKIERKEV
ncbi:hypothetical protein CD122_08690 [Staphylococcus rostri]|uniref:Uncharacterized protein n=1 Tax=Staphylococcus rostri TaxID=522262 RepID=A0A2K3YLM6_9STAP|nr:hypothetical protein [Staphylococcus rostri]PNZ26158.1 hypothetical protein CD122_08690 [Staphylococcus rostri]